MIAMLVLAAGWPVLFLTGVIFGAWFYRREFMRASARQGGEG
jgi:uncharacterized protein YneF (UPF0154 family)